MARFELLDILLFVVPVLHVLNAPYTKVEESFNLHAVHDVLMYGVGASNLPKYDHFVFPGAVPRSFIGSVLLAWATTPVLAVAKMLGFVRIKLDIQIIARLVLASVNAYGLYIIRAATSRRFGRSTGMFFTLLSCSQSLLPFWIGRTLPNMFALFPVNIAFALTLMPRKVSAVEERRWLWSIGILTATTAILRAELAMYLAPIALFALLRGKVGFKNLIITGLCSGLAAVALTTVVDSYFWGQWPIWPELSSLVFNVYHGKSAEWGVSPFHAYFSESLPKLLLYGFPLTLLGGAVDLRAGLLLVAPLAYIGLISFIGHKEWRFIVYVVPVMNVVAARGASWIWGERNRNMIGRLMALGLVGGLTLNVAVTLVHTAASKVNYPGGEALHRLHELFPRNEWSLVYIDDLSAQSGASLFLQERSAPFGGWIPAPAYAAEWTYDKVENRTNFSGFDFILSEARSGDSEIASPADRFAKGQWSVASVVQAHSGYDRQGCLRPWSSKGCVRLGDAVWILQNVSGDGSD